VDYVKVGVQPMVRNMKQTLLVDVLGFARGEDWWREGFEEVVRRGAVRVPWQVISLRIYVSPRRPYLWSKRTRKCHM